jgi:predicted DNA-binding protein with PD1-like motif
MTLTLQHVNPAGSRVYMGALTGGAEVRTALTETARRLAIGAASVELLGGLTEVELSYYDFVGRARQPPLTITRPLEIVAGHGTLSLMDEAPHLHLHLLLAFRDPSAPTGVTVTGGHVIRAVAFAVEFTLTTYEGAPVRRTLHPATGLQLWALPIFGEAGQPS